MTDALNFNTAGEQRSVIPAGTICALQMTVHPGGVGPDSWLKLSGGGNSKGLNCEFTVIDGEHNKRKFWQLFTLEGTTDKHAEAGTISRNTLRAIVESAKGIRPDDRSEEAQKARELTSWGDFNQLRFIAKLGVQPPSGNYAEKNTILQVVTPERPGWRKLEQIPVAKTAPTPPANAVARPEWGKAKS